MSEDFIQHSEERRPLPDAMAISVMALKFAHVVRLPSSDKSDKQTESAVQRGLYTAGKLVAERRKAIVSSGA